MLKKTVYVLLIIGVLISMAFATQISQVWKTGQTTSYSSGDDGALQKGVSWPSPRFVDNGDGTVTDNLTGLMWAQNASTPTVGYCTGGAKTWLNALSYIACLNAANYLGHNDWRLPNRTELKSLVDYSRSTPSVIAGSSNSMWTTIRPTYWSGSPYAGWSTGGTAWSLATNTGIPNAYPVIGSFYAWPVRGTSSAGAGSSISLSPQGKNFGNVAVGSSSTPAELTLSNAGASDLVVTSITITSGDAAMFTVAAGGSAPCASLTPTIPPSGNCTLTATFTPSSGGLHSSVLNITSNDPVTPTLDAPLSGSGAYELTVLKSGTGSGTVTSSPTGITCGSDCSELYAGGTPVLLTATAGGGSVFAGWSGGGCSGTGTCTVTMSTAAEVTALFNIAPPAQYLLTVSKSGTGAGTVTSAPAGISCGSDCSETYNLYTSVTLTALPDPLSIFTGWSVSGPWTTGGGGSCPGTGTCTVSITADTSVLAAFERKIAVITPNGGESIKRGTIYTISWTYAGNAGSAVKIELLKGGVLKQVIASSAPIGSNGSGSYAWSISSKQTVGSDYTIRITSTTYTNNTDISNSSFSITR